MRGRRWQGQGLEGTCRGEAGVHRSAQHAQSTVQLHRQSLPIRSYHTLARYARGWKNPTRLTSVDWYSHENLISALTERGINEQGGGGRERDREKERRVASLQRVALWHSPLTGSGTSGGGDSLSNNALSIVALNAKGKWSAATLPSLPRFRSSHSSRVTTPS